MVRLYGRDDCATCWERRLLIERDYDCYEMFPCFTRFKEKILERQSSKATKTGSGRARLAGGSDLRVICGLREHSKSIGFGPDNHANVESTKELLANHRCLGYDTTTQSFTPLSSWSTNQTLNADIAPTHADSSSIHIPDRRPILIETHCAVESNQRPLVVRICTSRSPDTVSHLQSSSEPY